MRKKHDKICSFSKQLSENISQPTTSKNVDGNNNKNIMNNYNNFNNNNNNSNNQIVQNNNNQNFLYNNTNNPNSGIITSRFYIPKLYGNF